MFNFTLYDNLYNRWRLLKSKFFLPRSHTCISNFGQVLKEHLDRFWSFLVNFLVHFDHFWWFRSFLEILMILVISIIFDISINLIIFGNIIFWPFLVIFGHFDYFGHFWTLLNSFGHFEHFGHCWSFQSFVIMLR